MYPDPTICGCLYIGNQAAYDAYLRKQTQQSMFDMQTTNVPAEPLGGTSPRGPKRPLSREAAA